MMEYKVRFYITYNTPWMAGVRAKYNKSGKSKAKTSDGQMHYRGYDLEQAVDKVRRYVAFGLVGKKFKCTSMLIQRGREKGRNIKWDEYHKKGEAKKRFKQVIAKVREELEWKHED